ncbi:MAG TPA: hypothetical protein DIC30_07620 [Oceanospirillales bacterium]|nr:hypothetical protein [Oceanospirillales bacterium]|tara:strand:- start:1694 stop:2413 length:720 start_codon:yes stop_codon:yes gene_type:complete
MRSIFSKNTVFASLILSLSSFSSVSSADFQADLGFASEYVRNGIKQSSAKPVIQGNLIYTSQTGLYGGAWISGVERGSQDSTRFELDGFAGFFLPLSTSFDLDIGYTYATFLGEEDTEDDGYGETFVNVLYDKSTTLGYRYSADYMGSGEDLQVIELAHVYHMDDFSFEGSVRNYKYLEITEDVNWGSETRDDYFHFRIGAARAYKENHFSLGLERTNLSGEFDGGTQIIFTYARQFNF